MKKSFYLHAIFMLFFILVSTPQTIESKEYIDIIKSWQGHHIDELIDKWGYPQKSFEAPNGNTVYVYHWQDDRGSSYFSYRLKMNIPPKYCTTYFEINSRKIIIKASCKGNACE